MEDKKASVILFFAAVAGLFVGVWVLAKQAGADAGIVSWLEGAILCVLGLFAVAVVANRIWEP